MYAVTPIYTSFFEKTNGQDIHNPKINTEENTKNTEDYLAFMLLDIFLLSTQCESRHALVQFVFFVMIVTSLGLLINSWLTVSHRLQKHK